MGKVSGCRPSGFRPLGSLDCPTAHQIGPYYQMSMRRADMHHVIPLVVSPGARHNEIKNQGGRPS